MQENMTENMNHENGNKTAMWVAIAAIILVIIAIFAMNNKDADDNMVITDENQVEEMDGVLVGGALMVPNLDIVENAMNADNVTTLVAAVDAAGLVETLQGPGPFTVFAPTNAAFEKLPAGTVDTLLMPENKEMLASILTYHVVPGRYTMADLTDGQVLTTVQGEDLVIGKDMNQLTVNGNAMVETADVISSNGVTFVIDSVLTPPSQH